MDSADIDAPERLGWRFQLSITKVGSDLPQIFPGCRCIYPSSLQPRQNWFSAQLCLPTALLWLSLPLLPRCFCFDYGRVARVKSHHRLIWGDSVSYSTTVWRPLLSLRLLLFLFPLTFPSCTFVSCSVVTVCAFLQRFPKAPLAA